ncbi:MBL fold metallo-hydrolase [Winogradskyella sp. PE311]|uniref:MBL fold metallo-hydrolase n=1 Tax=Winogradskyella sp. PE311 TaxID=3366943 RepID=UPI00397F2AC2
MGLNDEFFTLPSNDEIEVTLFGTGGGYGESIVIKINNDEWVIIDSCINPKSKIPLALNYLKKIGVNLSRDVKYVICTHWHNDHVKGLSNILRVCKNAVFCMPSVSDTKKFLKLVNLDYSKIEKGSISSFNEFKDCLDLINQRKSKTIRRLKSDLVIYSDEMILSNHSKIKVELFSLSPSEAVILNFDKEISTLFRDFNLSKKLVTEKSPNDKSAAIYFKYGDFSALLGADLEISKKEDEGWKDIYNNSVVIKNKSIIYKIPHHGSSNGYEKTIYEGLIEPNAITKFSPWNSGSKLPRPEMVDKYKGHSDKVYITSPIKLNNKSKKRDKSIEKIINLFSRKLIEVKFEEGIVRSRHSILDPDNIKVETFGNAFKV